MSKLLQRQSRFALGLALAATLALSISAVAMGRTGYRHGGAAASAVSGKPLAGKTIAYIEPGPLEYYQYSAKAAGMAVRALGGTAKIYNSQLSPQTELANVQDAVAQRVSGIVLFPLTSASEQSALKVANKAKVPITVLYGYAPSLAKDAVGFVQVPFKPYGALLGKAFRSMVPSGQVAIISGAAGRSEVDAFTQGFEAGFGQHGRIVTILDGQYLRQKAFSDAQDIITKYPNLKALVVGNEDMAIGAVQALGSKVKQVAVAAQNGSPEGNALLKQHKLRVTVGASPSEEATFAVRLLADAVAGRPAAQKVCNTPYALNTPTSIKSAPWVPTAALIAKWLKAPCGK